MRLHKHQMEIVRAPLDDKIFLQGMAGTGKTTVGYRRLRQLLEEDIPPESILVLVPQKALALPYQAEIDNPKRKAGGAPTIATIGSLALRMVELFWALVAEDAGFANPDAPPVFLTLEMVQYVMTKIISPEIDANDYFASVRMNRNRLFSQIVDNLNKAAVVEFPYTEIGERLKSAWRGDPDQRFIYEDAQACATIFREFCLEHNLLDFSLQLTVFLDHVWENKTARNHLLGQYRHLIIDNIEEDNPATHSILGDWLNKCDSALVIYDTEAGYRKFLGSDPVSALELQEACKRTVTYEKSFVMSDDMRDFDNRFAQVLGFDAPHEKVKGMARDAIISTDHRYNTQMINWIAENIASLIHAEGVPPSEIVVLAPLLSDALRFTLANRLTALGVPVRSHRPSRALRAEPSARALLTLTQLAHPAWGVIPPEVDVTYALMASIADLDLTRARILTEVVYNRKTGALSPFTRIKVDTTQQRVTYALGERYQLLYDWIDSYIRSGEIIEIDFFLSRLFGEVLSQPRFGFHNDRNAATVAANLVDSARNFRWTATAIDDTLDIGSEYIDMVARGVIADLYIREWERPTEDNAVLMTPAYTYLMSNEPSDYQFWLNIGGATWAQRLYQPLTHPYVLSQQWEEGRVWTDEDEYQAMMDSLHRLASGLIRRCRKQIYLGMTLFGETGYEQSGPLLDAISRVLRGIAQEEEQSA